jgi:CRISPR/Cas system-associated exonuclease Cas4 (RecB family)
MTLSTPLAGFRLLAKYDLLAIAPGRRAVIMDWKTGKPQPRGVLGKRLQTSVYRYVLVRAGAGLNAGQPLTPEAVEMTYWQAQASQTQASQTSSSARMTVTFDYSDDQYREDEARISELIRRIADTPLGRFQETLDDERCKYCRYRSLCDRGESAGDVSEIDIDDIDAGPDTGIDLDFDFGQIAEAQY